MLGAAIPVGQSEVSGKAGILKGFDRHSTDLKKKVVPTLKELIFEWHLFLYVKPDLSLFYKHNMWSEQV